MRPLAREAVKPLRVFGKPSEVKAYRARGNAFARAGRRDLDRMIRLPKRWRRNLGAGCFCVECSERGGYKESGSGGARFLCPSPLASPSESQISTADFTQTLIDSAHGRAIVISTKCFLAKGVKHERLENPTDDHLPITPLACANGGTIPYELPEFCDKTFS